MSAVSDKLGMEKILKRVQKSQSLTAFLKLSSHLTAVLSALAFGYLAVVSARVSLMSLLELCVILGVPFLAVTLIRHRINAPRPYELYDFYKVSPKKKGGMSFPSRHAYSAFAIGTALCFGSPLLGGILLLFSVLMCFARVLLGIHFLRDVLTGALVGTLSVLIGTFIFSLV